MTNENLHKDHRIRMRNRIIKGSVTQLDDHELLEVLLYSCYPRKNTNDIAHELLNKFGNLRGVVMANSESLEEVNGISTAGSVFFQVLRELYRRVDDSKENEIEAFESSDQIGEMLVKTYKYVAVEQLYLLLFDNSMRLIKKEMMSEGNVNSVSVDIKKLVKEAIVNEASCAIIAHNHPKGRLISSRDDAIMTSKIADALGSVGVELIDHILVAGDRYTSIVRTRYGF